MANEVPPDLRSIVDFMRSLLADELGTMSDGQPALWVEPPVLSTKISVTGLMCKIMRRTETNSSIPTLATTQMLQNLDRQVYLVQYDVSVSGMNALDTAIAKIQEAFPRHRQVNLNNLENYYPQTRFLLNYCELRNTRVHNP